MRAALDERLLSQQRLDLQQLQPGDPMPDACTSKAESKERPVLCSQLRMTPSQIQAVSGRTSPWL